MNGPKNKCENIDRKLLELLIERMELTKTEGIPVNFSLPLDLLAKFKEVTQGRLSDAALKRLGSTVQSI